MKISEMIDILKYTLDENGDQDIVIMTDGNRFEVVEVYANDEHELYLEGYKEEENEI